MVVSSFFVYLYRKKQDTDKLQQLIVQKRELLAAGNLLASLLLTAMRICLMNNGCRNFLGLAPQNMNLAVC